MMNNRDDNYRKLVEDLRTDSPVFITTNSINYDLMKDNNFRPFLCKIDLQKMFEPKPGSSVEVRMAEKYKDDFGIGHC